MKTWRRSPPISFSAPSPVFSATLPVKPSVTTTSVVPAAMSWPSTKPWNCGPIWLARRISAASRTVSSPFISSDPTFSRPMVGAVRPSTVRANTSPMTANSTRLRASQCTLAPRSSITTSPRADGPIAAMAGRSMPGSVLMHDLGQRQQRAGVAGRDQAGASPLATASMASRIDDCAQPQRRGRLHVAADHVRRVADRAGCRARVYGRATAFSAASSPTSRKRAAGWRSAASSRPAPPYRAPGPPHGIHSRAGARHGVTGEGERTPRPAAVRPGRRPCSALAGARHLTAVVVAAMAADVVRPLQLPAVGSTRHAPRAATPGDSDASRRGMGRFFSSVRPRTRPLLKRRERPARLARGGFMLRSKREPRRLAEQPRRRNGCWLQNPSTLFVCCGADVAGRPTRHSSLSSAAKSPAARGGLCDRRAPLPCAGIVVAAPDGSMRRGRGSRPAAALFGEEWATSPIRRSQATGRSG